MYIYKLAVVELEASSQYVCIGKQSSNYFNMVQASHEVQIHKPPDIKASCMH